MDQGNSVSSDFCLFVAPVTGSGDPGRLEPSEGSSAVSDLSVPPLDAFRAATSMDLSCCSMILRYDPRASLTSASESSSTPEVTVEDISWMAVTLLSTVRVPVWYFSMISRHFFAICNGNLSTTMALKPLMGF